MNNTFQNLQELRSSEWILANSSSEANAIAVARGGEVTGQVIALDEPTERGMFLITRWTGNKD